MTAQQSTSEPAAPLMVALTSVTRRPPTTQTIGGRRVEVRLVAAAVAGVIVTLPAVIVVGMAAAWNIGLLVGVAGATAGVAAVRWQPDGVPIHQYAAGALRARRNRIVVDGQRCQVHVGLAPAPDLGVGQTFTYVRAAVPVDPDLVDERGRLRVRQRHG